MGNRVFGGGGGGRIGMYGGFKVSSKSGGFRTHETMGI